MIRVSRRVVRPRDPAERRPVARLEPHPLELPTTAAAAVVANASTASPTAPTIHERFMVSPLPCQLDARVLGRQALGRARHPGPSNARSCKAADPSQADPSQIVPPIPGTVTRSTAPSTRC